MISSTPSPAFFNLTVPGRVPFVANPASPSTLTSSGNLEYQTASGFLGHSDARHGLRIGFSGETSLVAEYTTNFSLAAGGIGISTGGLSRAGWDSQGIAFYNGWSPRLRGPVGETLLRFIGADLLIGTDTDLDNGRVQIPSATTSAGGFGFGDFSLFRSGAGRLATNAATLDAQGIECTSLVAQGSVSAGPLGFRVSGNTVVTARRTGWSAPTGTASRAPWDSETITHLELARRVKALIDDLHAAVGGHGLIGD